MLEIYLAAVGGLALVLGLFSRKLRDVPLSGPLLAMAVGVVLGPAVAGVVEIPAAERDTVLSTAAQLVLAVSLMGIALRFPLSKIRPRIGQVALLIAVVMVGMAAIVAGLSLLILSLTLTSSWLLGAALAPTDPVLASSVVSGEPAEQDLPLHLRVLVSIESGANDGLASPLVVIGIVAITGRSWESGLGEIALLLGLAVAVGLVLGDAAGRLLTWAERHRDIEHSAFLAFALSLTAFVLGVVGLLGGEGILGVFVAGLAYNHRLTRSELSEEWEVQEAINTVFILPIFTLFGLVLPWSAWAALGWLGVAFATAVLLLRRLPLLMLFRRPLGLGRPEAAFTGWFGPIGVAALFYLTHAAERGASGTTIWAAGSLVIAASTVIHGVTATPFRQFYAHLNRRDHAHG